MPNNFLYSYYDYNQPYSLKHTSPIPVALIISVSVTEKNVLI